MKKILTLLLLMMIMPVCFGETEEVVVTLPPFAITVNDYVVDNEKEAYPFIQYKDITYMPMTWDMTYALGLKSSWTTTEGLVLSKDDKMMMFEPKGGSRFVKGRGYDADLVEFPVTVNGQTIDNEKETYPVLIFNNVTYFPMTYRFMVNEFGSGYSFDSERGLSIAADDALTINFKAPTVKSFTFDYETLIEQETAATAYFKLEKFDGLEQFSIYPNLMLKELDGKIVNIKSDIYDKNGDYTYSQIIASGLLYQSNDSTAFAGNYTIDMPYKSGKIDVHFEILSESTALMMTRKYLVDNDVTMTFVDGKDINKSYLEQTKMSYILSSDQNCINLNIRPNDIALRHAAINDLSVFSVYDEPVTSSFNVSDGIVTSLKEAIHENAVLISMYDEFKINSDEHYYEMKYLVNGFVAEEVPAAFIYLFNKDKELKQILIVKDLFDKYGR
jgi:hypothetical protein